MLNALEILLREDSWQEALQEEWQKPYMIKLNKFLEVEQQNKTILPSQDKWLEALNLVPLDTIKVVILGQDPYPTKEHADGLCFSADNSVNPLPKSLQNIYKELYDDLAIQNTSADLRLWAKQGVLLLNSVLTVEEGKANAHKGKGWEQFTDKVISLVNEQCEHVVFILWGAYAQKKGRNIDMGKHLVLNDPHPSPLSAYRGFWGSKPFSRVNMYLSEKGKFPIKWKLDDSSSLF